MSLESSPIAHRNPIHHKALHLDDLVHGLHVVVFDTTHGICFEGTVTGNPRPLRRFTDFDGWNRYNRDLCLVVLIRDYHLAHPHGAFAEAVGLVPYDFIGAEPTWTPLRFMVRAEDRQFLPALPIRH